MIAQPPPSRIRGKTVYALGDSSTTTSTAAVGVGLAPFPTKQWEADLGGRESGHLICQFAEVGQGAVGPKRQLPQHFERFPIDRHLLGEVAADHGV